MSSSDSCTWPAEIRPATRTTENKIQGGLRRAAATQMTGRTCTWPVHTGGQKSSWGEREREKKNILNNKPVGRYQYADNNPDGGGTEALLPWGVSAGQIRQVMSLELSQSGEILNSPLSISLKQKIYSWKNLSIGLTRTGGTVTATLFPRWQQVLEVVVRFDPRPPTASSVSVRCWGPQTKSNQMKMLHIYLKNVDVWPWWHVLIHIMK